jgi:hypothetical protein
VAAVDVMWILQKQRSKATVTTMDDAVPAVTDETTIEPKIAV